MPPEWPAPRVTPPSVPRPITTEVVLPTPPAPSSPPAPIPTASGREFQDKLKDGSLGPMMVIIPAGSFLMGSPPITEITLTMMDLKEHTGRKRWRWASFPPILGDCMTFMAMSRNGPVQSMTRIMVGANNAVPNPIRAARVCCGAARGTAARCGCAGLRASGPPRASGTGTGVFAWPGLSLKSLIFFPFLLFESEAPVFSFFFGG